MSDVCLEFEDLLVEIKLSYLDKKQQYSEQLWYAANAAYTKLTKYYTRISSVNFAVATVLDPRYKLDAYLKTQDPIELRASAQMAIDKAYEKYALVHSLEVETITTTQNEESVALVKKRKFFCDNEIQHVNELDIYLQEKRSNGTFIPNVR